jgi:Flp pilus assembly protein TadD
VVNSDPRNIDAHNNLGVVLFQSGNALGAVAEWETSLAIRPNDGNAQNNLAWALATYADERIRNPGKAVVLAEGASQLPGGDDPIVQRTLAAACAANNDFTRAIDIAQRASETARARGNNSLVETLQRETGLYRANTPYREMPRRN